MESEQVVTICVACEQAAVVKGVVCERCLKAEGELWPGEFAEYERAAELRRLKVAS